MKTKHSVLSALALIALLGAGCTSSTTADVSTTTTETDVTAGANTSTTVPVEEPEEEATGSASVKTDVGTTVTTPIIKLDAEATVALNVTMSSGNFFFKPDTITAKAGQTVNITFSDNEGYHTIVVEEINFKETVAAGGTVTFTAPTTPGSYPFICDVGKHAAMGMVGTLIVE